MEIRYAHKLCSVRIQSKFLRIEWTQWPDCYSKDSTICFNVVYRWDKCHLNMNYFQPPSSVQAGAYLAEFKDIYG